MKLVSFILQAICCLIHASMLSFLQNHLIGCTAFMNSDWTRVIIRGVCGGKRDAAAILTVNYTFERAEWTLNAPCEVTHRVRFRDR